MDQSTFLVGFISGFAVSAVFGLILNRINVARNAMRAPDRPMMVATPGTPRGVMNQAAGASRDCAVLAFLFVVALAGTLYLLYTLIT